MPMRINGCTSRRNSSWDRGDTDFVSKELTTRKMYGDKQGIDFKSETVVLKSRQQGRDYAQEKFSDELRRAMPSEEPRRARHSARKAAADDSDGHKQSTMNFFSGSSSKSSKSSGTGFFDRIVRDMEHRESGGDRPRKSGSSWLHGIGENVPGDKKACIERHLRWLEERVDNKPAPAGVNPAPPAAQPVAGQAAAGQSSHLEICQSIRCRISNLLMKDLPQDITAELRLLAREVEQLTVGVN